MKKPYLNPAEFTWHSERYDKDKTVPYLYPSDGATGAIDIWSRAWWVHDILVEDESWDDKSVCTNLQASWAIYDILKEEGRWARARYWFACTLAYGEARKAWRKLKS